jgi:putative hemolysin
MGTAILEVILILVLILANGVFALAEIAVISSRRARLQQRAEQGDPGAQTALELSREPARFLSTVQIGITLVGILAGAFSGATLAEAIAIQVERVAGLAPYAEAIGLLIVVLPVTYFSLVIGELLPKQLALRDPERIAARMARPMLALSRLAAPVVRLLSLSTDLLQRLLGLGAASESHVTPEEINIMVEQGRRVGVFDAGEQEIVQSALTLGDRRVSSVLTPRTEIVWIDQSASAEAVRDTLLNCPHVLFPVGQGGLDNVVGMLRGRDFLGRLALGQPASVTALMFPPLFVPESQSVLEVLELLKRSREHAALVIDEFGGLHGMVTRTDILEALVGEMPTRYRPAEETVCRADGSWLLDGRLAVAEFSNLLDLRTLPSESRDYETLGGFVMTMLGAVPAVGEHFDFEAWRFEVVDMDAHRVDRILAAPLGSPTAPRPPKA